jgi:hypothetical protein
MNKNTLLTNILPGSDILKKCIFGGLNDSGVCEFKSEL